MLPNLRPLGRVLATIAVLLSLGCKSAGTPHQEEQWIAARQQMVVEREHRAEDRQPYRMKISDVLDVKFYYTPELNETVTIRPDGKISLQLVGEVQAAGLTPAELDDVLTERYSGVLRRSEIAVIVKTFAEDKIYVGGEVRSPDVIPLAGRLTLVQALFHAGGILETANLEEVVILRKGDNEHPIALLTIDVQNVLSTGVGDPFLTPFDVVFVPKSGIAKVNQFVRQYIDQVIPSAVVTWVPGFVFVEALRSGDSD